VPRLKTPRRADRDVPTSPAQAVRGSERLAYLLAPDLLAGRPVSPSDVSLQIFHAGGREAELDEVCRRALASGLPLDEIEVACASEDHAALAWEKAVRLGWQVTTSAGVPATLTRPGRALLGWCDWIENEFSAARLRRLLQSGDVTPAVWREGTEADGAMRSAGQGARLLLRAGPAWGRETFAPAFARLRAFYAARLENQERDAGQHQRDRMTIKRIDRVDAWLSDLLRAVPHEDEGGGLDLQGMVAAARAFLADNAVRASVLDAASLVALDQSLAELDSLGPFRAARAVVLRIVRERVLALRVGADRPRPGALHVSRLQTAGVSGRALVFVVGLEEGRVFPVAIEDPVLLDEERAAIAPGLRRSGDRLDERVETVVTRLASTGREVRQGIVLSYSSRDTREFRETFPSWIVLQAFRLLRGQPALSYRDLADALQEPASAVPSRPADATNEAAWWLSHARQDASGTERVVLAGYPHLSQGREALRHRDDDGFTEWDGWVPEAGSALDFVRRHVPVSASTLEDAAACPFRFFLRQGLGVEPLEEEERQSDGWLDPLTRGRELHDLFADTLRRCRQAGRRPSQADADALRARGERRLEDLRRALPPPSEEIYQSEREDFLHDLHLFIEEERRTDGREPIAFEVSFGLPIDDPDREPLAMPEPVVIPLGDGRNLIVHGRIDRIDRLADGTFETVDYKTGRYWNDDWKGTFRGGRRLQHALYGRAAEAMLARTHPGARVRLGTYYFPSARGLRTRKPIETPDDATLTRVLRDLGAVLARGTFVQAPERGTCRFCEFKPACGDEPWARAGRKFAKADELRSYRDLNGHE
jgi:ATP-dependent helicase/nuclease subunit B